MANRCKREFFNDSHKTPQPRSHDTQHFKRNLWMSKAKGLKILLADRRGRVASQVDSGDRGWIIASIEHREFRDRNRRGPRCSEPALFLPRNFLKIRTCPDSTTKSPAHGSPSAKTISPAVNCRGTVRCAKNNSSASLSPGENGDASQSLARLGFWVRHADHFSRGRANYSSTREHQHRARPSCALGAITAPRS